MRRIEETRTTGETDITIAIVFPTAGTTEEGQTITVKTGVPFFDHMLHAMLFHGGFSADLTARGDTDVDDHHTVEDVGIVFGRTLLRLREEQGAVRRFGHAVVPMDDALAEVAIDLGGRPYLVYDADYPQTHAGTFDAALVREFFQGVCMGALANIHTQVRSGLNTHHMIEALFKSFGRALAVAVEPVTTLRSTKGVL